MAETLSWRSFPVADDFPRSLLLIAAAGAACVGIALSFRGAGYGLLSAALLGLSLARYFLPTWYELGEAGVAVRFLGQERRIPWAEVKRATVHRAGVFLSPFERPSRLESFRGTFLRFAGNAEEVVSFVERRLAAAP